MKHDYLWGPRPQRGTECANGTRVGATKGAAWEHPKGHASWCSTAVPYKRHGSVGDTQMAKAQCSCGRNTLAKSLRKLAVA